LEVASAYLRRTFSAMNPNAKIFAGTGSQKLAEQICKSYGCQLGKINIQKVSAAISFSSYKAPMPPPITSWNCS
jgi:hypothetical protein